MFRGIVLLAPNISKSYILLLFFLIYLARGWASGPLNIIFPSALGKAAFIFSKLSGEF